MLEGSGPTKLSRAQPLNRSRPVRVRRFRKSSPQPPGSGRDACQRSLGHRSPHGTKGPRSREVTRGRARRRPPFIYGRGFKLPSTLHQMSCPVMVLLAFFLEPSLPQFTLLAAVKPLAVGLMARPATSASDSKGQRLNLLLQSSKCLSQAPGTPRFAFNRATCCKSR